VGFVVLRGLCDLMHLEQRRENKMQDHDGHEGYTTITREFVVGFVVLRGLCDPAF
jgi:hypothetical protein